VRQLLVLQHHWRGETQTLNPKPCTLNPEP